MLSLPLAKLSTAQDAAVEDTKFSWTHATQDLIVVFDSYGASSELLKVVQGNAILVRAALTFLLPSEAISRS